MDLYKMPDCGWPRINFISSSFQTTNLEISCSIAKQTIELTANETETFCQEIASPEKLH